VKSQYLLPGPIEAILLALALILPVSACAPASDHFPAPPAEAARARARPAGCVNLNTASVEELMTLPGVGEKTARRIIEHREEHGAFTRPEEVIIVEGFSERKYRAIAPGVCAE